MLFRFLIKELRTQRYVFLYNNHHSSHVKQWSFSFILHRLILCVYFDKKNPKKHSESMPAQFRKFIIRGKVNLLLAITVTRNGVN